MSHDVAAIGGGADALVELCSHPRRDPAPRRADQDRPSFLAESIGSQWWDEELLHAVVASSPLALYVVDLAGKVQLWNPACETLFGWTSAEALGRRLPFVGPDSQDEFDRLRHQALVSGSFTNVEGTRQHRDGHAIELSISTVALHDRTGTPRAVLGISQDITARKAAEAALLRQTQFDALTGLHSRGYFFDLLDAAMARPRCRDGVVYLDLDNFKDVNDSYGHEVGDGLLVEFARLLREAAEPGDVVARMGGDEFAVLIHGVGPKTIESRVRRLYDGLNVPVETADQNFSVRVTGGASLCRPPASRAEVLRAADVAMYEAKKVCRGRFLIFDRAMQDSVVRRVQLEAQLVRAIDRDELVVYYQPTFRLRDGGLAGVEALVRWRHPEHGLLPPGQFIPLAEASGAIVDLGRWVLERACEQLEAWHDAYPGAESMIMSINLSPRQLQDPDLLTMVTRTLDGVSFDPGRVQLEVTETVLAAEGTEKVLRQLRDLGVHLAIDDFGTGYSSLSALRRCPFDTLKVDQSFVAGIEANSEDLAIVTATLGLGRALGLRTVAEGVETHRQLEVLTSSGCDEAQGYLLGRPGPPAAIERLLVDAVLAGEVPRAVS